MDISFKMLHRKLQRARPCVWAFGVAILALTGWLLLTLLVGLSGFMGLLADIIFRPAIIGLVVGLSVSLAKWLSYQRPLAVIMASFLMSALMLAILTAATTAIGVELPFYITFLAWNAGLIPLVWLADRFVNSASVNVVKKWPFGRLLAIANPVVFIAILLIFYNNKIESINLGAPIVAVILYVVGALSVIVCIKALVNYYRHSTLILASVAVPLAWMICVGIVAVQIDDSLTQNPYPHVIPAWVILLVFQIPMLWALVYIRDICKASK